MSTGRRYESTNTQQKAMPLFTRLTVSVNLNFLHHEIITFSQNGCVMSDPWHTRAGSWLGGEGLFLTKHSMPSPCLVHTHGLLQCVFLNQDIYSLTLSVTQCAQIMLPILPQPQEICHDSDLTLHPPHVEQINKTNHPGSSPSLSFTMSATVNKPHSACGWTWSVQKRPLHSSLPLVHSTAVFELDTDLVIQT